MADEASTVEAEVDWQRRVVGRSLRSATERSVDRGARLIRAAGVVLERSDGGDITVQDVADEAGQSLRTLYQYFESKDDLLLALFEESMRAYARLLEKAVDELDDPLERLAGAMLAALRMPEVSDTGLNRGLVRLRLRLADSSPELVGRAQAAVVAVMRGLVVAAQEAGRIELEDADAATFMILSTNTAVITAQRVGNDAGVPGPDRLAAVRFCLGGLGADVTSISLGELDGRIAMPPPARRSRAAAKPRKKPAAKKG